MSWTEGADGGFVPSPELVAALFVLGGAPLERVPWWATHWLVIGHDGQVLRDLAGRDDTDVAAVAELLPAALAEMSVALPATATAAAALVFHHLARQCLSAGAGERWVVRRVDEVVTHAGRSPEVLGLPLGHLSGIDDAWWGGSGPPVADLRAAVRAACAVQLAQR
ncbi:hypothetical protein [Rugosimonospora africana]|uniref:Uncharacterized protein n=1 Tax=Rugosimonospora africana TaxID=556532 RepID=A0A8J3QW35_9ACTN|nr:hypothetical protein [Rugosimonospora africana]GIH17444.1 hypothetical protein Raf01_56160 [Rugosimonospora africana]